MHAHFAILLMDIIIIHFQEEKGKVECFQVAADHETQSAINLKTSTSTSKAASEISQGYSTPKQTGNRSPVEDRQTTSRVTSRSQQSEKSSNPSEFPSLLPTKSLCSDQYSANTRPSSGSYMRASTAQSLRLVPTIQTTDPGSQRFTSRPSTVEIKVEAVRRDLERSS